MLSLGEIEVIGFTAAVEAADVAVKTANVELLGYELANGGGMVSIKVVGQVGAVRAAISAAKEAAAKVNTVVSTSIIARPSDQIDPMVLSPDTVGLPPTAPPDAPEPPEPPAAPEPPSPEPNPAPNPPEPEPTEAPGSSEPEPTAEPAPSATPQAPPEPEPPIKSEPEPSEVAPTEPHPSEEPEPIATSHAISPEMATSAEEETAIVQDSASSATPLPARRARATAPGGGAPHRRRTELPQGVSPEQGGVGPAEAGSTPPEEPGTKSRASTSSDSRSRTRSTGATRTARTTNTRTNRKSES